MIKTLLDFIKLIYDKHNILYATTVLELKKRYAGSFLGVVWIALYPVLFLSVYIFLYLIVFKVQYPNYNTLDSIIYIFSGLVPYIAFMEAVNGGAVSIRANIHYVKSVIMPVEFIPYRVVMVSLITQAFGLGIIFILSLINLSLSWHILILPLAMIAQTSFLMGLALFVAPLGIMIPDISYFMNILTLLLMFVSPIGYVLAMLSGHFNFLVYGNPIYYMIEPYRMAFMSNEPIQVGVILVSILGSLAILIFGIKFFNRFKTYLADYE